MFEGLLQPTHLILILAIVLIIFGAGRLPEAFSALGRGVKEFRDSSSAAVQESTTIATASSDAAGPASPSPASTVSTTSTTHSA